MNNFKKKGFTLVELMIVAACTALLIGPIFFLLRSGSQTSRMGMLKIETTLESRRILKQIHRDLKLAVIPLPHIWSPGQVAFPAFTDILTEEGTPPEVKYSFYSYPVHAPLSDGTPADVIHNRVSKTGFSPRNMARITYEVSKKPGTDSQFMILKRTEDYNGQSRTQTLTDRLNYFRIKIIPMTPPGAKNQYFFFITLQLIDSLNRSDMDGKVAAGDVNLQKASAQSKIVLADFFDIVYPEYFHAFWNHPQTNPSWHTFPVNLPD